VKLQKSYVQIFTLLCLSIFISSCASNEKHTQLDTTKQKKLAYIHYQLGIDAIGKKGMLPKAFDELMESDAILANQPHVMDALAYAWLLHGNLKKAENYYIKALKFGSNASIFNNYANLLNRMKQYKRAETNARQALDDPRYPNQDLAFINLGIALAGQQKLPEATQAFQQAKLFNSSNPLPDFKLADIYFKQGKLREAGLLYESLFHKQQNNRIAVEGLIAVLNKQHDEHKARLILRQFSQSTSSAMDKAWALNQLDTLDLR